MSKTNDAVDKLGSLLGSLLVLLKWTRYLWLSQKHQGEYWTLERAESWFEDLWDNCHNPDYNNCWKENSRMSGRTFEKLVNLLHGFLEKQDTYFRKAHIFEIFVAAALSRLANRNSFRTITKTLAVRKLTARCRNY